MANTRLDVLKLKAQAANMRRIAEANTGSMRETLLSSAREIEVQIEKENEKHGGKENE